MLSFCGPAPLHHTLLVGRTRTGITLQTLDLKRFDQGVIIDQTPAPGFDIPNPESCTVPQLLEIVAPKGAQMLVDGIRNGLFVPPTRQAGWRSPDDQDALVHAAKIKPEDRHISWTSWDWLEISRRSRVIGPLWNMALVAQRSTDGTVSFQKKRIIFSEIEEVEPLEGSRILSVIPGVPFVDGAKPIEPRQEKGLYVYTRDGKLIRIRQLKVEGEAAADGVRAALKARMLSERTVRSGSAVFTPFHNPFH